VIVSRKSGSRVDGGTATEPWLARADWSARRINDPPGGFSITLRGLRITVTGSGKRRSTHEAVLWENALTMPGALREGKGISIPIATLIPAEARETDKRNATDRVIWRLIISAAVPGIDYNATFEVPVFRTAESETPLTPEERAAPGPGDAEGS
jgi:hypothetical protein